MAKTKKPARKKKGKKAQHTKTILEKNIWGVSNDQWNVHYGQLASGPGKPANRLFRMVGEKIPYEAIDNVRKHALAKMFPKKTKGRKPKPKTINGVYIAHDSMGSPRYVGRGNIFGRLKARKAAQKLELVYFSFYVVETKSHEREIETLLIRAAGPLLEFNDKKKRIGIQPGAIGDYEAGTVFYERQYKKGKGQKG